MGSHGEHTATCFWGCGYYDASSLGSVSPATGEFSFHWLRLNFWGRMTFFVSRHSFSSIFSQFFHFVYKFLKFWSVY